MTKSFSELEPSVVIEKLDKKQVLLKLDNVGIKEEDIYSMFVEAQNQLKEETNNKTQAERMSLGNRINNSKEEAEFIEKYKNISYSYKNTLKFVLNSRWYNNISEIDDPVKYLQQQKDLLKRLRDFVQEDITELIEKAEITWDERVLLQQKNSIKIGFDALLGIYTDYIRDASNSALFDALNSRNTNA